MRTYPVLKCIILFICVLAGIIAFRQSQAVKTASEFENKEQVYACEILDMFEIADIGNEEMQAMLLPKVSAVLTEKLSPLESWPRCRSMVVPSSRYTVNSLI